MIKYNLYFKNVPLDSTEEELKEFFSLFGEIKSLKLMRKKVEVAASHPI
jgi:RNA recognition motif-containing protein